MKKHTEVYYNAHGYPLHADTYVPSELGSGRAQDIHHLVTREDRIENLMAVSREEHEAIGEKKHLTYFLLLIHKMHLDRNNIPYDINYFVKQMPRYYAEIF